MANKELIAIYLAGLIQGISLVAFPAASSIFTNPHEFNFSSMDYGILFIPQAIFAIISSALSPVFSKWWDAKTVFFGGLFANLLSMLLLALSASVMHSYFFAFTLLILATTCLGIGFGLTVPTLNMMAGVLRPDKVDSVILILNALLGVGTVLAPVFIALFMGLGVWWGLPLILVFFIIFLFVFCFPLSLPGGAVKISSSTAASHTRLFPYRFWIFAAFALLYGIVETLNGNWIILYMKKYQTSNAEMQSFALAVFWGMVTLGRLFFAGIAKYISESRVYQFLPFILAGAFIYAGSLPPHHMALGISAFALAGFGCSALLPLTISFGTTQLKSISGSVAGGVIAFYLLGYGIAAFGVGPLLDMANLNLRQIYGFSAIFAIILGVISYVINHSPYAKRAK